MPHLEHQIDSFKQEFNTALYQCKTIESLEKVDTHYLGKKGIFAQLNETFKQLPAEQKKMWGSHIQSLKEQAQAQVESKRKEIIVNDFNEKQKKFIHFDVTASQLTPHPVYPHIYTTIVDELEDCFISMGFDIVDGPEIETDYYNFETMNISKQHPARDSHDTFWVDVPGMLLRTHTSSVQSHQMESRSLPLAIFAPGRCYRNEATDASHDFMFTQAECLLIDKNISMAHLLKTAQLFLQKIFNSKEVAMRIRPAYFPFVEPGVEIDASCTFCQRKGCSVCKQTGWIELLGAGLVHPHVLQCNGIDSEIYSGFAFGFGIERIAMIKHKITDIRLFHGNSPEFLRQF